MWLELNPLYIFLHVVFYIFASAPPLLGVASLGSCRGGQQLREDLQGL